MSTLYIGLINFNPLVDDLSKVNPLVRDKEIYKVVLRSQVALM